MKRAVFHISIKYILLFCIFYSIGGVATADPATATPGPSLRRVADLPDGAPAFEVRNAHGVVVRRIECLHNGYYQSEGLVARLLASTEVMAHILARDGNLVDIDDLGPAKFDCVLKPPAAKS
jgi:hypothetical protein